MIQGIPIFQVCNNHNDTLRNRFSELEQEEMRIREEIKEKEKRLSEIKAEYKELNKAEVYNVLDYVRSYFYSGAISKGDLDMYLCHCQNKLNGNINSVFLRFDDPVDEKKEEKDECSYVLES